MAAYWEIAAHMIICLLCSYPSISEWVSFFVLFLFFVFLFFLFLFFVVVVFFSGKPEKRTFALSVNEHG